MKRSKWAKVFGVTISIVLTVAGLGVAWKLISANQSQNAFDQEIRMAHNEGLPVTWQEFANTIPTAPIAQNAAPLYVELTKLPSMSSLDLDNLDRDVIYHPSAANSVKAEAFIGLHVKELTLLDAATKLPRCWFNRNWSHGEATLMQELSPMKSGARLLASRGSRLAAIGDSAGAIRNANEILTIARHVGEEGTELSTIVRDVIRSIAIQHLAAWAFHDLTEFKYKVALKKAIDTWEKPDLQKMYFRGFLDMVQMANIATSMQGRKDLGFSTDQSPSPVALFNAVATQPKARVELVRQSRLIWEALSLPLLERVPRLRVAEKELGRALLAFTTDQEFVKDMTEDDLPQLVYDARSEGRKQVYLALLRAIGGTKIPTSIDTRDLRSPFDGRPLSYTFDGHQMSFSVSDPNKADDGPVEFKLPPDKPKS